MQSRRVIPAVIIPGESITRFHMEVDSPMLPDSTTELHVAHHTHGDLNEPADWYNIFEHPTEWKLELARKFLNIDEEDWKILEHIIGSFRWAIFHHQDMPRRAEIRVDTPAMKAGEWTTTYF